MNMKDWLQLGRVQTAPGDIMIVLVPYLLNAPFFTPTTLLLAVYVWLMHFLGSAHNGILDTAMGYDTKDPNKQHHALVAGRISLRKAHNVIHFGYMLLIPVGIYLSITSVNPIGALSGLLFYVVAGHAYNDGLSKESELGFIASTVALLSLGFWGYFLGAQTLSHTGWVLMIYGIVQTVFMIAVSGHLKEIEVGEPSNLLIKLGAHIKPWKPILKKYNVKPEYYPSKLDQFIPGKAKWLGLMKAGNILIGVYFYWQIATSSFFPDIFYLTWLNILTIKIIDLTVGMLKKRWYDRNEDVQNMSLVAILTIYLPIPLVLNVVPAVAIMAFGVIHFFVMNKVLWGWYYPKV